MKKLFLLTISFLCLVSIQAQIHPLVVGLVGSEDSERCTLVRMLEKIFKKQTIVVVREFWYRDVHGMYDTSTMLAHIDQLRHGMCVEHKTLHPPEDVCNWLVPARIILIDSASMNNEKFFQMCDKVFCLCNDTLCEAVYGHGNRVVMLEKNCTEKNLRIMWAGIGQALRTNQRIRMAKL